VNVLVLGDSDSSGEFSDGTPWPVLVEQRLAAASEQPSKVTTLAFSPLGAGSPDYAVRKVREHSPDAVIIAVGSFWFTAKFVWLRVEHVFGKRAGRWYQELEHGFERRTAGKGGLAGRANSAARWLVPRILGKSAYSSREAITENYRKLFDRLAQVEDVDVVVMSYPGMGAHAREGDGPRQRGLFFADIRAAADAHRFSWVDGVEVFATAAPGTINHDGLHFGKAGHELIATAIEGALLQGRGR